jgi:hypothetical protein
MLIATVHKIAKANNNHPVYVIEAFLMTIFGVGGGLASLTAAFVTRSPSARGSRLAEIARLFLLLIYSVYSTWFWFHGINVLVCHAVLVFFGVTADWESRRNLALRTSSSSARLVSAAGLKHSVVS